MYLWIQSINKLVSKGLDPYSILRRHSNPLYFVQQFFQLLKDLVSSYYFIILSNNLFLMVNELEGLLISSSLH